MNDDGMMHKPSVLIILFAGALGLFSGYFATQRFAVDSTAPDVIPNSPLSSQRDPQTTEDSALDRVVTMRSSETLESLIAQGEEATYATLALWLLDANPEDIAAYGNFRKGGKMGGDQKRLLFIHWTRLAPEAAIAAVADTSDQGMVWWAWAASEPERALTAAGADRIKDVARGIGEFHPKWVREHFDSIPEAAKNAAIGGVTTWKEDEDHVATLDFLSEHQRYFQSHVFRTLARKDPWAAFDWLQKTNNLDARGAVGILLESMRSTHPEDLERLDAMTSPGSLKRKIEDARFTHLLSTDPEAAFEQARNSATPFLTAKRLAEIGSKLLTSDAEQAFELGAEVLAAAPNQLAPELRIQAEGKSQNFGSDDAENVAANFMGSLLTRDPERTLGIVLAGKEAPSPIFNRLATQWANQDLPAYMEWVNRQETPAIRTSAVKHVVRQLVTQEHFQEAAEWATSGGIPDENGLYFLAHQWRERNPDEAAAWLQDANLSPTLKRNLGTILSPQP
ncbi:MAG TPA: hypothetical protein VIM57_11375 [Luteolibacter sp.]